MINEVQESLHELISTNPKASQKEFEDLVYILCNEFHWTQEDIWNTDIPFIFNVLSARVRYSKTVEKERKKLSGKHGK